MDDDLNAFAADLRLELVRGPSRDDPALVDDGDLVRELVRLLEVLRRQEQVTPSRTLRPDHVPHTESAARVETGRRLVEEEHARTSDQGAREVEPAPHAARIGLGDPVGGIREPELLQQVRRRAGVPRSSPGDRGGRTSRGSRGRSGSRPPRRTGPKGRSSGARPAPGVRHRAPRPAHCRHRRAEASSGSAPWSSCPRRSGRAGRARFPRAPRDRRRRARAPHSCASGRP